MLGQYIFIWKPVRHETVIQVDFGSVSFRNYYEIAYVWPWIKEVKWSAYITDFLVALRSPVS